MQTILLTAALAGTLAQPAASEEAKPAAPAAPTLDGMSFSGRLVEAGKTKGDRDQLVFKDGKFTSTACTKYGFLATPYKADAQGARTGFEAVVKNAKGESMEWTGGVEGGRITAKAVYTNVKGKKTSYVFREAPKSR